jgi:hypothetical protein
MLLQTVAVLAQASLVAISGVKDLDLKELCSRRVAMLAVAVPM